MASKIEALVRNFLKTDGDALCVVPGEKLFLRRGDARSVVGREAVSDESFRGIADELAPGELMEGLVETGFCSTVKLEDLEEAVPVQFGRSDGRPCLTISRGAAALRTAATGPGGGPSASSGAGATAPAGSSAASGAAAASAPSGGAATVRGSAAAATGGTGPATPLSAIPGGAGGSGGARAAAPDDTTVVPPAAAASRASTEAQARGLDRILLRMLAAEASDLHLSAENVPVFRVHGEMVPQQDLGVMSSDAIEQLLQGAMPDKNLREFAERSDTDLAYEIAGVSRFRMNVFRDRKGVGAVLRQIPFNILSAAQLNLPPAVVRLGELHKGMVLVTGPTGSGKSTTLAAIVDHINETRTDHIITIEDPIEFVHPNKKCLVNQREVGGHTRSFKDALRAALREDPDIVLVGEMRDLETVSIAIETAETGHLVFGTLHTTTAASTVDRLIDQFPEDRQAQIRVMLADCLRGVVSQTLLKKKGGGRVAALEVLLVTNAVSNLIRDGKTFQIPSIMQTSRGMGMQLLNDALLEVVKKGLVEPREAYLKAVDKPGLLGSFRSVNVPGVAELLRETGTQAQPTATAAPAAAASGK